MWNEFLLCGETEAENLVGAQGKPIDRWILRGDISQGRAPWSASHEPQCMVQGLGQCKNQEPQELRTPWSQDPHELGPLEVGTLRSQVPPETGALRIWDTQELRPPPRTQEPRSC